MARNVHRVPRDEWKRWGPEGQALFNHLYTMMRDNMSLFLHPRAPVPKLREWKTTAWNAAWEAATFTSEQMT